MMYQHTQKGTLIIGVLSAGVLVTASIGIISDGAGAGFSMALLLAVFLAFFSTLTVSVGEGFVCCRYGPVGLLRKRIPFEDIVSVQAVRNSWLAGWGVRWLRGGTTLWNVSGLDAVELIFKSGKRFRIGTDQPEELSRAIENAIHNYK